MAGFSIYYVTAPLIGGVIGYITNYIAIKMLFRPHTAKYLFGMKLPFTPGIIPKEKGRIAEAIGGAISQNLMNHEVLSRYLLSEGMKGKVRHMVEEFMVVQKRNSESVADFLKHYMSEKELQSIVTSVNIDLTKQVHSKLADSEVGKNVAHIVVGSVVEKMKRMNPTEVLGGLFLGLGGLRAMAAKFAGASLWNKFFTMLQAPAERMLTGNINKMLEKNGEEIVSKMLGNEVDTFINTPVCKLLEGKDEQIEQVVNTMETVYQSIISDHLPRILESIDISKIVRDRINEMSMDETEKIIFQVMDKELKAIVWLGALLGTIMGCINIIFR
ncbi:MAG: DUF445 family protein [Prevotella sp.]|nr:DUF445 family protein [Prevotella sp.]